VFRKDQGVTPREMAEGMIDGNEQHAPLSPKEVRIATLDGEGDVAPATSFTFTNGTYPMTMDESVAMDVKWLDHTADTFMMPLLPTDRDISELTVATEDWMNDLFPELIEEQNKLGFFQAAPDYFNYDSTGDRRDVHQIRIAD